MVEALAARFQDEAKLWHQRLGHLSYGTMARRVRDQAVTGMRVTATELQAKTRKTCKTCVLAKHAESNSRAKAPLALIHSDFMGPMKPKSAGGNVYILTAVDDYSGYAQIVPLKHKNEASGARKKVLLGWERRR